MMATTDNNHFRYELVWKSETKTCRFCHGTRRDRATGYLCMMCNGTGTYQAARLVQVKTTLIEADDGND